MKILSKRLKEGAVKVRVDNLDDLWYLYNVIEQGDHVKAKTERRIKAKDDQQRSGKSMRKTITLVLEIEKTELNLDTGYLRIQGLIREGPEDLISLGSHHTFNVSEQDSLWIIKENWSSFELGRLKEAQKAVHRPRVLIVVIDSGEATFASVRESSLDITEMNKNIGGKSYDAQRRKNKKEFYQEINSYLKNKVEKEKISAILLGGPGFEKDNLYDFLKEKEPAYLHMLRVVNCSSAGKAGVHEIMRQDAMKKINQEVNAAKDLRYVDSFLKEVGKDSGKGVYGKEDVANASNMGAVETLLVNDDFFQENRREMEELMKMVQSMRGEVHLVNHRNEAGDKLASLGGVGAILRYAINTD